MGQQILAVVMTAVVMGVGVWLGATFFAEILVDVEGNSATSMTASGVDTDSSRDN